MVRGGVGRRSRPVGSSARRIARPPGSERATLTLETGKTAVAWYRLMNAGSHDRARIDRSLTERLYLLDETEASQDCKATGTLPTTIRYDVRGSKGSVYQVQLIKREPQEGDDTKAKDAAGTTAVDKLMQDTAHTVYGSCACHDFQQRWLPCKHLFFLCYKVFRVPRNVVLSSTHVWSAAIERMLTCRSDECMLQDQNAHVVIIKKQWAKQRWEENEACPICCDPMQDKNGLGWCKRVCGKSWHEECMAIWMQRHASCVYCRAKLVSKE